jgi:hypothetical protein
MSWCCICICMNKINFESKHEVNSNQKNITRNVTTNSSSRNILIRNRISKFYPPLKSLQNSLGFWYSRTLQDSFGSGRKVQICPYSLIYLELTPSPTFSDHNSWTVGRMRVYLCFLKSSQNSLSLWHWTFLLILHHIQSAEFCEIIVSPNQNLYSRFFHFCTVFQWL